MKELYLLEDLAHWRTATADCDPPVRLAAWPGREAEMAGALRARGISPGAIDSNGARVRELAAIEAVRWIEPDTHPRLLNDYARAGETKLKTQLIELTLNATRAFIKGG